MSLPETLSTRTSFTERVIPSGAACHFACSAKRRLSNARHPETTQLQYLEPLALWQGF